MKFYTRLSGVIDISDKEDIKRLKIEDLIYGCKNIRRFGNQIPWTVAEHSLLVAHLAEILRANTAEVLACLMHDLSEGLLSDLQSPLRQEISKNSKTYEDCHLAINTHLFDTYLHDLTEYGKTNRGDWTSCFGVYEIATVDKFAFWIEYYYFIRRTNNQYFSPREFQIPDDYESTLVKLFNFTPDLYKTISEIFHKIRRQDLLIEIDRIISPGDENEYEDEDEDEYEDEDEDE